MSLFTSNVNNQQLHVRYWEPPTVIERIGVLYVCHGLSDHMDYYEELAQQLTQRGLIVFGHDHIGMGKSDGKRFYVDSHETYVRDILLHCTKVKKRNPGLPMYALGFSFGANLIIAATLRNPAFFKGLVLVGPIMEPYLEFDYARYCYLYLCNAFFPNSTIFKISTNELIKNPVACQAIEEDDLCWNGEFSARLTYMLLCLVHEVRENLGKLECPFLILQGEEDPFVFTKDPVYFSVYSRSRDKDLIKIERAGHHLILEKERIKNQVFKEVSEWLEARISGEIPPRPQRPAIETLSWINDNIIRFGLTSKDPVRRRRAIQSIMRPPNPNQPIFMPAMPDRF